jgi:thioredoxin 1
MRRLATFLVPIALILVGAGCAPTAPVAELPTTPPSPVMEKKDEAMMAPKEDTVMEKKDEAMMAPKKDAAMAPKEDAMMAPKANPYYIAYTADGVAKAQAEGRPVVLYFFAAWCPICVAEDPKIKAWVEAASVPVAGFRVDYDQEKELKARYKIPYQHTTVFLNAQGEEVERFTGPKSQVDFEAAFARAAK